MMLIFEEEAIKVISKHCALCGKMKLRIDQVYDELDLHTLVKWFLVCDTAKSMLEDGLKFFRMCVKEIELTKKDVKERRLLEFCDEKQLCKANTWFQKKEQKKVTRSMGANETGIDFVLCDKNNRKY